LRGDKGVKKTINKKTKRGLDYLEFFVVIKTVKSKEKLH
jgi:hypothetical protein